MKNVLLVDDLPEALEMLAAAIGEAFPEARCVRARGVREATDALSRERFDLALVDLVMTDGHGVEVIGALAKSQPLCATVVSMIYYDDEHLFHALQAGAQGYLLKDQPREWLVRQLLGISQGQPPLSPAIARRLLTHFRQTDSPPMAANAPGAASAADLSARERDVLGLLAQGERIADIAIRLGISRHTVGDHVKNIYRKLNIGSRAEAALHARGMGLA